MCMEEGIRPQQEDPVEMEQAEEPQATVPLRPPPQPPLPPSQARRPELGEGDHLIGQVGKLGAPPPSTPKAMEQEEQRQAGDGGVTMVVVADKSMNGGADNEEPEHPQAVPQAAPQTSVLVLPPSHSVEETEHQMVVVVEVNGFSKEDVWKRTVIGTRHHMVRVRGEEKENEQEKHLVVPADNNGCATANEQQQQHLPAKEPPTPWPLPTMQELPAGVGALIARSDP